MSVFYTDQGDGSVLIRVKAVPGASRDQVVGVLGDQLKIRVSAPPEGGKANKAIVKLLAKAIGVRAADVVLESGGASAVKVFRVQRICRSRLGKISEQSTK